MSAQDAAARARIAAYPAARQVAEWFLICGLSKEGAAAMAGNAGQESGWNPLAASNTREASIGLFQWRDAGVKRRSNLVAWCARNWLDWRTIEGQCKFAVAELQSDYKALYQELVSGTAGVAPLASKVCWEYERPAKSAANERRRIKYAKQIYAGLGSEPAAANPPNVPAGPILTGAGAGTAAGGGAALEWLHGPGLWVAALASAAAIFLALCLWLMRSKPDAEQASPALLDQLKQLLAARAALDDKIAALKKQVEDEVAFSKSLLESAAAIGEPHA